MRQNEYNDKQIEMLCKSYINFIATFPNTDWLTDKDDEKYFDTVKNSVLITHGTRVKSSHCWVETHRIFPNKGKTLLSCK